MNIIDPIEDYFNIFSTRITVMSTIKTRPAIISGRFYKYYPVVDYKLPPSKVANLFIDTLNISKLYLKGLGGDYDGDQVSSRGVFDINANKKCEEDIYKIKNLVTINGSLVRTTELGAIQTLYALSCNPDEITN